MRAINHAVTGALIGYAVPWPVLAVMLALVSHFALDAVPHHGDERLNNSKWFSYILLVDAMLCIVLVGLMYISGYKAWWVLSLSAFAGTSPDFMWFSDWRRGLHKKRNFSQWYRKLHKWVQWSETPKGIIVEILWLICASTILAVLLLS